MSSQQKFQILKEDFEVVPRLMELELDREKLIEVANEAVAARADVTLFDPVNSPGILAYIYGTRKLRFLFSSGNWVLDRTHSIESIKNDNLKIKVVFQNVDVASSTSVEPKPISAKGAGSEKACIGNQATLPGFDRISFLKKVEDEEYSTYYLMVDKNGAAELSMPIIRDKTFAAFVERIFVSNNDTTEELVTEEDDQQYDDDFNIIRKKDAPGSL